MIRTQKYWGTLANIAALFFYASPVDASPASEGGEGCSPEPICAGSADSAEAKARLGCKAGTGYDCNCRESRTTCGEGVFGKKKQWFNCSCKKKPPCRTRVCALYEGTASAAARKGECGIRESCKCKESQTTCDTNWRGASKHYFDCTCE